MTFCIYVCISECIHIGVCMYNMYRIYMYTFTVQTHMCICISVNDDSEHVLCFRTLRRMHLVI